MNAISSLFDENFMQTNVIMDTDGSPDFTRRSGEGFQKCEQKMFADKVDMEPTYVSEGYEEISEHKIF
jgi:hypothetical protein